MIIARSTTTFFAAAIFGLTACTINPVTGERQLSLVSAEDELAIGRAQYLPSRQMQGGDYVRDPALTAYVRQVGDRLAAVSDRNLPYEFVVLNSSVPNAWALPGGKIAINRGLLVELSSEAELAAVLGHEIVHAAARHSALAMQRGLLLQGAVLVAAAASRSGDYSGLAVGAASLGAQLVNMRNSRGAELESDRFGMEYMARAGYDPQAAISLQETFLRLSESRSEQGWLSGLFASHPPSAERVQQNRATAATLPSGGEIGRDRYQAAVSNLIRSKPAYDAHDRGRAALADGDLAAARNLANQALQQIDNEAQFHALLGDIEIAESTPSRAVTHFDDAIALDPNFFYYHIRKARAHQQLEQWALAESAYSASLELLPTADAYLGLGQIAERRGDSAGALVQYRQAAEASGPAGDAARDAIVRLDLPQNPDQYLQLANGLDASGRLIVEIVNPTQYAVDGLVLAIRYADSAGQIRQTQRTLSDALPAGSGRRVETGLGPFLSNQSVETTVVSARIVNR